MHDEATSTAGTAEAGGRGGCPVCQAAPGGSPSCPRCGWLLYGDVRLGPLDAAVVAAFEQSLAAARREFDLLIAADSSGAPLVCPPGLGALIRGGPPGQEEWVRACFARRDEQAGPTARELAAVAADDAGRAVSSVTVAEITDRGLTVGSFDVPPFGDLVEHAAMTIRDWPDLVPVLSFDEHERMFQLAGGVGVRPLAPGLVAAALARGLPGVAAEPGGTLLVVNRLAGWQIPDAAVASVLAANPGARAVSRPPVPPAADDGRGALVRLPGPVVAAALSRARPAGRGVVAIGRPASSVAIHSLPNGGRLADLTGTEHGVTAVAVSADGSTAAGGGPDGVVAIGGLTSATPPRRLAVHDGPVSAVLIHTGSVFSLGADGVVVRTPLDGSAAGPGLPVGRGSSAALAVSGDAQEVAVGGDDRKVAVWNRVTASRTASVRLSAPVTALDFEPGGRTLVAGAADGSVSRLDPARRGWKVLVTAGGPPVRALAALDDGSLAFADGAGRVRRFARGAWDTAPPAVVGVHAGPVVALGQADDGRLVTVGGDGLIRYWPVDPGPWAFVILDG